jgi:uncharacterized membrane protein (UPF0127 family)
MTAAFVPGVRKKACFSFRKEFRGGAACCALFLLPDGFFCKIPNMKIVRVFNATCEKILCENCAIADNPFTRIRGLLGRSSLEESEGLLIVPCSSIHMFGVKFALDVIFISRENIVVDFVEDIAPGKMYIAKKEIGKAHSALEITPGTISATGTKRGDKIDFQNLP